MGKMLGFFIFVSAFLNILSFQMQGAQGGISTTTTATLATTATTVAVADTDGFKTAGIIVIGNEVIKYTGKTATSFTGLTRGVGDTPVIAAASGTRVYDETLGYLNLGLQYQTSTVQNEIESVSRNTFNPFGWGAMLIKHTLAPPFITGDWRIVLIPWYVFVVVLTFSLAVAMAGLVRSVFLRN